VYQLLAHLIQYTLEGPNQSLTQIQPMIKSFVNLNKGNFQYEPVIEAVNQAKNDAETRNFKVSTVNITPTCSVISICLELERALKAAEELKLPTEVLADWNMLIDEISHSDKEKGKARNKDPKLFLHHL
jgi:hypothetical protein